MARKKASAPPAILNQSRSYLRFTVVQRIQHLLVVSSFVVLAFTGLAQKFPLSPISLFLIEIVGGIESARTIHHAAAVVLILVLVYHILEIGYKLFVLRVRMTMLPSLQDVRDAWLAFMYNLGLARKRPQMGRYTFEEKAEYWALVWGALIMALTGFLMWNPIAATRILPGEFIPAAKAAHGAEAVLAVLAVIVWHIYGVHIKRLNRSMYTGRQTEEEMLHEHPLELADIKAGMAQRLPDPALIRKRQRIYLPIAAVLAFVLLGVVYEFVSGEKTALTTIPPQENQPEVFVPQTPTPLPPPPPTPTLIPATTQVTETLTWEGSIGTMFQKCTACHGTANPPAGLNLSTYADAMAGSADGPVIVPGDSADSKLVLVQQAGGHPGQFLPEEIALIAAWIDAGAPEK